MMKKIILGFLATVTLVACSDKNDEPEKGIQQSVLPAKKIKTVSATFIELDSQPPIHSLDENNYLNSELYGQYLSQQTEQFAYDYDNTGRITRITIKKEGKPDRENTFTYIENKVKMGLADQDNGGIKTFEIGLNAEGNFSNGVYNEKKQLKGYNKGSFTWIDDNLTKINRTITYYKGETSAFETQLTYYNQENKNRFHLYHFEGDVVGSYMQYFGFRVGFIEGLASKNLVKEVSLYTNGKLENYTIHYTYSFDSEGFVTGIKETRNARVVSSSFGYAIRNNVEGRWNNLQTLIANIQQGIVKDKSYQLVSDKDNKYIFNIIVPIKVENDVNGKPINIVVNKVCQHTFTYEVENGVRKYKDLDIDITFNSDLTTSYILTY